jgi:predicted kinase
MATLHLMCGLPGSGKTTLAKQLEQEHNAVRLSPDEWMAQIVGDGYDESRRAGVEAVQWKLAQRLLSFDIDVILENGFWTRAERDLYRVGAKTAGATVRLHYQDVTADELKRRLRERNEDVPEDAFYIPDANIDAWALEFEPPAPDELQI